VLGAFFFGHAGSLRLVEIPLDFKLHHYGGMSPLVFGEKSPLHSLPPSPGMQGKEKPDSHRAEQESASKIQESAIGQSFLLPRTLKKRKQPQRG